MDKNHEGHRERLRKKFVQHGFISFEEHEVLELLLFYSIPRKNTNEIAHNLIYKFGDLNKVFDADMEMLQEVDGVNESSANLIKMIPQICKIYFKHYDFIPSFKFKDNALNFAIHQYIGETNEVLKAVYLDKDCNYISCEDICTMDNDSVVILNIKKIIERAEKYNSGDIILMHNHPDGNCLPSDSDIYNTLKAIKILKSIGITLIDHIVVSKNNGISMFSNGYLKDINSTYYD
ncbi:MAG: hypothetical protein LUG94_01760 [Ruminococcus sp.]|nr:hypothetical protein [Ruminococcus sp.]